MVFMKIMEAKGRLTTYLTIGFKALPNYGNDLRRQYNYLLTRLAKSEMLSFLLSQMQGKYIPITKKNPDMWKEIQQSNYSLC